MWQQKRILAIIPARGGSKGIPRKNLQPLGGRPLIAHSIEQALACSFIDTTLVSTDDAEIAAVSQAYGAEVPFLRPAHLAQDQTPTIDALRHALDTLASQGEHYDVVVLLQPTQPLRAPTLIADGLNHFFNMGERGLVSVSAVDDHPILMRYLSPQGTLTNLLPGTSTVRRQDFAPLYKVNGALYINTVKDYHDGVSLNDNPVALLTDARTATDIDTPLDLAWAEFLLTNHL